MSLPALVSNDGTPFVGAEDAALVKEASGANDNVLKRSLRGGFYGAGSQLLSAGAGVADALGADQVGAGLHAKSRSLRNEAALPGNAPRVGSYDQLSKDWSLDNAAEYVGGLVGGSLPVTAAGIAGGIATGGAGLIPAALGAAGATLPFHMGEVVQQQQDDPQAMRQSAGQRFGNQLLGGAGAAAVEGLVPGMVGRQVLGKGMANLGKESIKQIVTRNAMDIPLEGFTEGAGTAIKGYAANQDKPTDWNQIKEAAIGGAAAGSVFTGVGTTADLAHSVAPTAGNALSSALTSTKEKLASAKDSLQGKADEMADTPTGKKAKTAYDDFSEMLGRGKKKADDTIDRIMKDLPPGVDLEEFAKAAPERAAEMATEGLKNGAAWAQKTGEEMLAKMVDGDPRRQAVVDALAKGGERTGVAAMAALKKGWDLAQKAGSKIDDFAHAVNNGYKADRKRQQNADIDVEARFVDDVPDDHMNPDGGWLQISNTESANQQAESETGPERVDGMSPGEKIKARKDFIEARVAKGADKRAASAEWEARIAKVADEKKAFIEERMVKGMSVDDARKEWESKPKKSEDYSGANKLVLDVIQNSGLREKRPELFAEGRSTQVLADTLRSLIGKMTRGPLDSDAIFGAIGVLDDAAADTIDAVRKALDADPDPAKTEQFFRNLNEIDAIQKRGKGLRDMMRESLTDEAKKAQTANEIDELSDRLVAHARGDFKSKSPAEEAFLNNRVAEFYAEHFGPKADAVRAAVEKEAGIGREGVNDTKVRLDENGNEVEASEGGFDEQGNRLEKAEQEIMKFGLSKPDAKGHSKSAMDGAAMLGDSRYARQHLLDLKAKYPEHDVRFEYLPESNYGHIVVEKRDNPGEFNDADLASMKLDAKKHSNSPSRLEVGGHIIDAVKVAKTMRRKMQDKFDGGSATTAAQRLVDGFKQGIAQLTVQFGETVNVPDNAVIGYLNGNKPLTWGAAKKMDVRTDGDKVRDASARELENVREALRDARLDHANAARAGDAAGVEALDKTIADLSGRMKELVQEHTSVLNAELARGDDAQGRSPDRVPKAFGAPKKSVLQRSMASKDPTDTGGSERHANAMGRAAPGAVARGATYADNGGEQDTTRSLKGDKDGNIHEAADRLKEGELIHRSNMDGTGQWVSSKADMAEALANLAHELKARTSAVQRALGDKILGLTTTEVQVVMTDKDRAILGRVLALKKPSEQAAVVNPLAEKYSNLEQAVQRRAPKAAKTNQKAEEVQQEQNASAALRAMALGGKEALRWESAETGDADWGQERKVRVFYSDGTASEKFIDSALPSRFAPKAPATDAKPSILQAAIDKRQDFIANPPADYSAEKVRGIIDWATQQKERVDGEYDKIKGGTDYDRQDQLSDYRSALTRLIAAAKTSLQNDKDARAAGLYEEGSPDPKAVAAKKAAFIARAASGDKTLLAELNASTDAKGLQRAAAVLPAGEFLDAINARLAELVQDEDVAYGLGTKKYSMESTEIHEALEAEGFGATHDSPIRHEGKFDWRAHQGKGEGNASFGAGTYLSTADGVHRSYKQQFTASTENEFWGTERIAGGMFVEKAREANPTLRGEALRNEALRLANGHKGEEGFEFWKTEGMQDIKSAPAGAFAYDPSPTYHVSVNIKPEQLLDWDKPLSKQSALVQKALDNLYSDKEIGTGNIEDLHRGAATGAQLYSVFVRELGSQRAASDALQEYGILGHKYAASGGRNDAHPNFVIYDDAKITTNYVHFDKSATNPSRNNTSQAYPGIKTYIERVLGKSVRLAWAKFAHAGEFQEIHGAPGIMGIIRLSVHALDPLSTAYHESLHAFIAQLNAGGNKDIAAVLLKAASAPQVVRRLNEMYKNQPAVLRQLADAEERAAYMYQAWAAGSLTVGPQTRTIFERIADLVRSVLGIWSNDQRALHIFQHFNSGEYAKAMGTPSANRAAMMAPGRNRAVEYAKPLLEPLGRLADAMVSTGDDRLRDTNIPALIALADKIKRRGTTGGGDQGFIPAARIAATKRLGSVAHALEGYSQDAFNEALEALQGGSTAPSADGQAVVDRVRSVLRETRRYMRSAGVDVGDLGPDYFPRIWDTHYISKNEQAFRDMLEPYVRSGEFKGDVTDFIRSLTSHSGFEEGIETNIPGMQHAKRRELNFLKAEDVAPFLKKDLMGTLTSYINQAARRAEWERRLGWDDNLKDTLRNHLLKTAVQEGATPEQIATAAQYLRGVDGTLGDDINPHARRLMGDMIVYQNVRLLPMAMFSMMVDPMGVMVRGGTITEAFDTFKRGMTSIPATFRKGGAVHDEATRLAELVGVVDAAWLSHVMGDVYTQGMVGGFAEKVNHTFFKYNMVEGLNRAFRVGASEAAMSFIAKHADGKASTHSQRWIEELGLRPGDIKVVGKRIALTTAEGLTQGQVARVHAAINQWVDGAMLRPDAADRPIWMNDPHFALISHMKQFVFSFQKTILARILHEMKFGNYSPATAIAGYVPMMIAADTAKGLIQGGGDEPAWKKNWGVADYVGYGIQRAGLYGVGQFGVDAAEDVRRGGVGIGALTGPTLEQLADGVQAMGGNKQFAPFLLRSMPANALYKDLFDGGGTVAPKPEVVVE